jgi:hypothetical protein
MHPSIKSKSSKLMERKKKDGQLGYTSTLPSQGGSFMPREIGMSNKDPGASEDLNLRPILPTSLTKKT